MAKKMASRKRYPTDLSDHEWNNIVPLFPYTKRSGERRTADDGRPREIEYREIVNAIRYVARSGGAWRLLPHDFPKWQTVYYYHRKWARKGLWERIHTKLRKQLRVKLGRNEDSSAGVIDSQSVKTTCN